METDRVDSDSGFRERRACQREPIARHFRQCALTRGQESAARNHEGSDQQSAPRPAGKACAGDHAGGAGVGSFARSVRSASAGQRHARRAAGGGWSDRRARAGDRRQVGRAARPHGGRREQGRSRRQYRCSRRGEGRAQRAHVAVHHRFVLTINPHLYASQGFDPQKDLVPVSVVGSSPSCSPSMPRCPRGPGRSSWHSRTRSLNFGSAGFGTPPHLAFEYLKS